MNYKSFNNNDLIKCKWQYKVVHKNTNMFKIGEYVFLKSNPENVMKVINIDESFVSCEYEYRAYHFRPETILQYKYKILQIYNDKYPVCFN